MGRGEGISIRQCCCDRIFLMFFMILAVDCIKIFCLGESQLGMSFINVIFKGFVGIRRVKSLFLYLRRDGGGTLDVC